MHHLLLNSFELIFTLIPDGPILVKSGVEAGVNPTLPDMNFVRSIHPESGRETIYLPGSSLKGVFRSHAERIAHTLNVPCCNPLDNRDSCGKRISSGTSAADTYKNMCTICRIFGHMVMGARLSFADAYPAETNNVLPIRQMVAIDRRSGSSANTFNMEVSVADHFEARFTLQNYERWQVGLLAMVLRDLGEGRLRVGFGKSRGMGTVRLELRGLRLTYADVIPQVRLGTHLIGVASLAPSLVQRYGLMPDDLNRANDILGVVAPDSEWGTIEYTLTDPKTIEAVLKAQVTAWVAYVNAKRTQHS